MATTAQPLDSQIAVETPEQVMLSYTIAGIGSRSAAALIDTVLWLGAILVIYVLGASFVGHLSGGSSWARAVLGLIAFAIFWGYFVLFEGLWDGQTPGKRRLGLRVVRDGGYSVGFGASAVRNLVRIVDMQPMPTYGVGVLCALLSPTGKRLGDYAAGTMVVRERAVAVGAGAAPPRPVGGAATGADARIPMAVLTDEEYALLDRYLARRATLDAERRTVLAAQLAARFRDRAAELTGSDSALLLRLHEMEREARARGASGRSGHGAVREQHAIVARGTARWQEFAAALASAQRRGLAAMSEAEVSDFVSRYRELAGDLARLQTATRGHDADALFALSRLVAGGHNLLYQEGRLGWRAVAAYMTVTVPREIRRSALPIGIAAAFLFAPAVIAYVAVVQHPSVASQLVPAGMIDRAERGVEWARSGKGYIAIPDSLRPVMASDIMTHNIQVAVVELVGGLAAGLGTILSLAFNGISIGAILGLYQSKGILSLIVRFVAPHGVLELSAFTFSGAAGLLIGSAFLIPGAMTRREALIQRGRRAIRLVAATALMLAVAGTLEGLVSPIPGWSLEAKLAVSAVTAIVLAAYISSGRGGPTPADEPGRRAAD